MRRFVLSFPFAIVTFLIGLAFFTIALSISDWDPLPAFEVPFMVREQRSDLTTTAYITPREEQMTREVYLAVLEKEKLGTGPIVLEEFTNRGGRLMDDQITRRDVDAVQESTIVSYELRNREPRRLQEVLGKRRDIFFFTEKDDKALVLTPNAGFEDIFEKRFPGSHHLLSLSNVGFNTDHTEALVYFAYYCGSLCAGGSFIVLRKSRDRWVVDREIPLWVS